MEQTLNKLKLKDVVAGDILTTDGGFSCLPASTEVVVMSNDDSDLYINCEEGEHYLSGQLDTEGFLVGLTRKIQ